MSRCPNQCHIRARAPTHIMDRLRGHLPTTSRTRAPGPKLLTARTNRWEIPRMSTRTSGGPPGVPGLLDHETQIRPRAHKNHPTSGKRSGTANLHERNGAARNTRHARPHQFLSGTGQIHHHGWASSSRHGRNRSHTHPGQPSWSAPSHSPPTRTHHAGTDHAVTCVRTSFCPKPSPTGYSSVTSIPDGPARHCRIKRSATRPDLFARPGAPWLARICSVCEVL
jgi:hypothetical protein